MGRRLDRRALLAGLGTTSLALGAPQLAAAAQTGGGGAMQTRLIPRSGEALPVVGIGTWQTFDIGTDAAERAQRREVLRLLLEAGGSVIDSSPMYGRAEGVVGDLLAELTAPAPVGRKPFLATKVWTTGEQAGIRQMETSLARLRASSINLMQVHNLVDWRVQLATMRAWRDKGRFRYLGLTHYTAGAFEELARILRSEPMDFLQIPYSITTRQAEHMLLPLCLDKGIAVIANQPFDAGRLFDRVKGKPLPAWAAEIGAASWPQLFLRFTLAHPAITCVIPGTAKPDHARDNLAAGLATLPDAAAGPRAAEAFARL